MLTVSANELKTPGISFINKDDFYLLKNAQIPFLRGPGDPEDQTAEDFFEKYESEPSS